MRIHSQVRSEGGRNLSQGDRPPAGRQRKPSGSAEPFDNQGSAPFACEKALGMALDRHPTKRERGPLPNAQPRQPGKGGAEGEKGGERRGGKVRGGEGKRSRGERGEGIRHWAIN